MTAVTDLAPGTELPSYDVVVSAAAMKPTALVLRDPNPIHLDAGVVRALGLGDRVINQGPLNAAYVWEMLSRWSSGGDVLELELRFVANAYDGDRLQASGRVVAIDADTGAISCEVWLCRQDGVDVVRGRAVVAARTTPAEEARA